MINYYLKGYFLGLWILLVGCHWDSPPSDTKVPTKPQPSNHQTDPEPKEKDRVIWQNPDMVIKMLGDPNDLKQKVVADLGAGNGFFTFRLAGKCKKVIALEINSRFIGMLDDTRATLPAAQRGLIETRLVEPNDPKLLPQEVDNVLIVNTYMYITNRVAYLKTLKKGLKPNGQVLIVDYKETSMPEGPKPELKLPMNLVERELQQAGFKVTRSDEASLTYQYIVTATH